jgi:integrase
VHRVVARAKEYFYYAPARGTAVAGARIRLPSDPHSPEFWTALRQAQGITGPVATNDIAALIDSYLASWATLPKQLAATTQDNYRRGLTLARKTWGKLPAKGLRPIHVREQMKALADRPGTADNFLTSMQALSKWARTNDHIDQGFTEGVAKYGSSGGHKPWTAEQIAAAKQHLTGMLRRGVLLELYTGQRGSDMVRLGPTMIDDGGFDLGWKGQVKTGVRPWVPILPELAAEMQTWEKRPGPYVLTGTGRPFSRKYFAVLFREATETIPELKNATLHGLRCTAVVNLKRAGLSPLEIADAVGMSLQTVERYLRFENKRESGKAVLVKLAEARNKTALA